LEIYHLEQLNSKISALLSTIFSCLKIEHLIKQIGIIHIVVLGYNKLIRINQHAQHSFYFTCFFTVEFCEYQCRKSA
ncbi:hypothetical protein CWC00_10655, partial [Pseudoalteromonas rubra]